MATSKVFYDRTSAEYKFYSTIACVDLLRGLAAKENWDAILAHSTIIKEYLERCANSSKAVYETSFNGLRQLYAKFAACDAEECQQGIRDIIDSFSLERGSRVPYSYVQYDFARLISSLAQMSGCKSVFDPFAGKATFADYLPQDITFEGQEINPTLCMLANLRLASLHRGEESIKQKDSFNSFHRGDMIASELPFGLRGPRRISVEGYFLEEAAFYARKLSVGIYPYGILFRGGKEQELRKSLIESDLIDYVIKLPARLYVPYSGVQTCIIITNRYKRNEGYVRFIDASSFVIPEKAYTRLDVERLIQVLQHPELENRDAIWVRQDTILANDANLAVERYQPIELPEIPEGCKLVSLNELLVRISNRKPTEEAMVPLVRVSDLAVNPLDHTLASFKVEKRPYRRECFYVDEPAIFISRVGSLKPTGYVEDGRESGRGVYLSPDVYAFRIIGEVSTPYLLNELTKDYVQKQLMYAGSYIQTLTEQDFLNVQILLPSLEEQNRCILESVKEEVDTEYREEIRTRKHAIQNTFSQPVIDLENFIRFLMRKGSVSIDDKIGSVNPMSVRQVLESVMNRLKVVEAQIVHLNSFDDNYGEIVDIDLNEIIQNFIQEYPATGYKYSYEPNGERIPKIKISKRAIDTIVNNIISNAQSHGFIDNGRTDYEIVFRLYLDKDSVVLEIANNGAPLDSAISSETVFEYYVSSKVGKEGHSGMGGYDIRRLLKKYGATVELISTPNEHFTVTYRINFTNINVEEDNDTTDDRRSLD